MFFPSCKCCHSFRSEAMLLQVPIEHDHLSILNCIIGSLAPESASNDGDVTISLKSWGMKGVVCKQAQVDELNIFPPALPETLQSIAGSHCHTYLTPSHCPTVLVHFVHQPFCHSNMFNPSYGLKLQSWHTALSCTLWKHEKPSYRNRSISFLHDRIYQTICTSPSSPTFLQFQR